MKPAIQTRQPERPQCIRGPGQAELIDGQLACRVSLSGTGQCYAVAEQCVAGCGAGSQPFGQTLDACLEPGRTLSFGIGRKLYRAGKGMTDESGERAEIGDRKTQIPVDRLPPSGEMSGSGNGKTRALGGKPAEIDGAAVTGSIAG